METKQKIIKLIENEIDRYVKNRELQDRYANDLEQGYLDGLHKVLNLIDEEI